MEIGLSTIKDIREYINRMYFYGENDKDEETGMTYKQYQESVLRIYPHAWTKYGWVDEKGVQKWKTVIVIMPHNLFYERPNGYYQKLSEVPHIGELQICDKVAWKSAYLAVKDLENV
jgi:hypothetical protein